MKTEGESRTLVYGKREIPYRLYRAKRKRLRIVVSPELEVDIYAPNSASEEHLLHAIQKKAPWIARTLDKQKSYHPLPTPKNYVSGETFVYLGRQYRLKIERGSNDAVKLRGPFLWVWVDDEKDVEHIRKAVNLWYRKRAHEIFNRYSKRCYEIASRHGVPEPLLFIREMRKRWGSCSSAGRITLNVNLVKVPVHCIEYVIFHELCHMKHHNHSKAFYSLLTRCLPDWRKRKETLDKFKIS
ncbi:MAG: M48 family metallopeptidase [Syntrophales bacterium]|jgi:predicted metal-dependent hydrolase|nr:M48 family metallopeptidase [Syntrophales bacterium]